MTFSKSTAPNSAQNTKRKTIQSLNEVICLTPYAILIFCKAFSCGNDNNYASASLYMVLYCNICTYELIVTNNIAKYTANTMQIQKLVNI
jgi:hypothetical protein